MDRISGLNSNQVAKELQGYKRYKSKTQKEIKEKVGNISALRDELRRVESKHNKDVKSPKSKSNKPVKKSPTKTQNDLLPESIYEILLRADLETIQQYCMTHKTNLCKDDNFWNNKLKGKVEIGKNLPSIYIDEHRTVEHYIDNMGVDNISELWKVLYTNMNQANVTIKNILLINKIEKNSNFNKSDGIIKIELYESYEDGGSDALIHILPNFNIKLDNYTPNYIQITLIDNDYKFDYTVLDLDTEEFITYSKILDEKEIINILTLFLFDYHTLFVLDIIDDNNNSFLPINDNINPNSPLINRERIWDTLKYLVMYNLRPTMN